MADERTTPAVGNEATGRTTDGFGIDLRRFGQEVAGELGVDPNNLGAYGLTEQKLRQYEAGTHSGNRGGRSR